MSPSQSIIAAFCDQFASPLSMVKVDKINNVPYPDAWQTALWDKATGIGFLALAYEGQLHIHLEQHGATVDGGITAGKAVAAGMGIAKAQE